MQHWARSCSVNWARRYGDDDQESFTFVLHRFQMEAMPDLDNGIDDILTEFEQKTKRTILHAVSFY